MVDVLVIGGGNAALCAALTAREAGASVRSGLGATLQPGAAISHLDHQALRVIGIANPILSRPNFLVSLSDDELTPAGLAARVILSKVMRQLVESDRWPGATLYVN